MKGVILVAGKGRRLYPLTKAIPKALLPIYDRPVVYYALDFMKRAGVRNVTLVVSEYSENLFRKALGDGTEFGLNLEYRIQECPNGTASALKAVRDFIEDEETILYYGDNVLLYDDLTPLIEKGKQNAMEGFASMICLDVANPSDYGVLEIEDGRIISLEEKPLQPKSNTVSTGIYFYPRDLFQKLDNLELSPRGEYEMHYVNLEYLEEKRLCALPLPGDTLWYDAGDFDSLLEVQMMARDFYKRGEK